MFLSAYIRRLFTICVKQSFIFFLFLSITATFSQNFEKTDAIAMGYLSHQIDNVKTLANIIEQDFETDLDKTRALYIYLTHAIKYNLNEYKYGADNYSFRYSSKEELETKIRQRDLEIINKTLRQKTAICEGYSMTFNEVCNLLNIKSTVISGYTRTPYAEIGELPLKGKHAWNAVFINSKWNFIDTTWGAGYSTNQNQWLQSYDDYYFFPKASELIFTHYPENTQWQLLNPVYSKKQFSNQPISSPLFFKQHIKLISPVSGIISSKQEFLMIQLKNVQPDVEFGYAFEKDYYLTTIIPEFKGDICFLKIPLKSKKNTTVNLLIDAEMILQYKIN